MRPDIAGACPSINIGVFLNCAEFFSLSAFDQGHFASVAGSSWRSRIAIISNSDKFLHIAMTVWKEQSVTATTLDVFPLTLFKDSIPLPSNEKADIVTHILQTAQDAGTLTPKVDGRAWTGDIKGHEFLFRNPLFANLSQKIGYAIRDYVKMLGVDGDQIEFFYQRSWATVTRQAESIASHSHTQSNISFAYYPLKPENSGDIQFSMLEIPNEFSRQAFTGASVTLGFIKELQMRNAKSVVVDVMEDDIVIFPSKTTHATLPNRSGNPRISISGDVSLMLKESAGHEHMMPKFSNWQQF